MVKCGLFCVEHATSALAMLLAGTMQGRKHGRNWQLAKALCLPSGLDLWSNGPFDGFTRIQSLQFAVVCSSGREILGVVAATPPDQNLHFTGKNYQIPSL
jgi:hypothetical protein